MLILDDTSPITVQCGTGAGATGAFIGNRFANNFVDNKPLIKVFILPLIR